VNTGRGGTRLRFLGGLAVAIAALAFASPAFAVGSFQVNSAADTLTAFPVCDPLAVPVGTCTLRDALTLAAGTGTPNTIGFKIGSGPVTIAITSALPTVPVDTTIDGTGQPGWVGPPLITLEGSGAGAVDGLELGVPPPTVPPGSLPAGNDIVRGLAIVGFSRLGQAGIRVSTTDDKIVGNYIGVAASGSVPDANATGIAVGARSTTIGGPSVADRNVISGNAGEGISVVNANQSFDPNMGGEAIEGNLIGTAADGTSALGNGSNGVHVVMDGIDNGDQIGGTTAGAGNTIANNAGDGVFVSGGGGRGLVVRGNSIDNNAGLGIEMAPSTDESIGAPTIAAATFAPGGLQVSGSGPASSSEEFDIYASPACDPSGSGEGAQFLGTLPGNFPTQTFSGTVAAPSPGNTVVTAVTVSDVFTDSSAFSVCATAVNPTFTVTTGGSSGPGSLTDAITQADAGGIPANIVFAIPGGGPQAISTQTALPVVTVPVSIDGTTESGTPAGSMGIFIDNSNIHTTGDGLVLGAGSDGSVVRGLAIGGFTSPESAAIRVFSNNDTIAGNYIGTDPSGLDNDSNLTGVLVQGSNNLIGGSSAAGRNVVSGNQFGIQVTGATATGNRIVGNYVGLSASGTQAIPGSGTGIILDGTSSGAKVGGTTPGSGNVVVSADTQTAVQVNQSTGNFVNGNLLGTDATGSVVLGDDIGVELDGGATANTIGSVGPGANVIAGSDDVGVLVNSASANTIAGNFIGTDRSGTPLTTIRNDEGVRILNVGATGNTFSNNRISSSTNQGIEAAEGPNTISGNTIDHNGGPGITVAPGTTGVTISGNSIDLNTGLGIDIGGAGITPTGPSSQQSLPTGLAGTVFSSTVRVTGMLASAPNTTYTVEFFASPTPDPSGNGEGAAFLGSIHVATDGTGAGTIEALLTPSQMPAVGQWLSATTTAPDGSTSEFATSVQLQAGTDTTVSIAPEADTFVDAAQPGENFDTLDYSDVYGGSAPAGCVLADGMSYTLMRFDLSAIPAGATIVDAQLQTTTRAGYAQDGDPAHWALFLPDDSWDPTTVTWNTRPADGTVSPGSSNATGGGDIRQSNLALGAAGVFRASCGADNAGDQATIFPSTSDGGLQPVAQGITNLADHITSQRSGDGKLSLELWTPSCLTNPNLCDPGHDNYAYWARYYTTRASDPKLRPSLRVTYSAPVAPTASITLSTGGVTNVVAGAPQVQLANFPLSALVSGAFGVNSSPVGSIPVGSIPVGSIPVGSIPVGSIPVGSIGLTANQALLATVPLSTIPLTPPSSWAAVLAGTPLATQPLQSVTLAQVLANTTAAGRLASVPVGSINLQNSPVGSIPVGSIPLGSIPVGSIPVPPAAGESSADSTLARWCQWLSGPPINCTSTAALGNPTLMSLALQGAPVGSIPVGSIPVGSIPGSIPIGSIPVGSIPLGSIPVGSITIPRVSIAVSPIGSIPVGSIPVGSIPVGSIPVGSIPVGSIDLQNSPVGSIPVGSIPVGSIVFTCSPACPTSGTLASNAAQIKPSLTFEQLLRAASPGTFDHITFADLIGYTDPATLHRYTIADLVNSLPPNSATTYADVLALLLQPGSIGWETVDLNATPVQNFATGGSTLDYNADFHLTPNGGPPGGTDPATINVAVPSGFLYQPGTTKLLVDNGSGFVTAPTQPGDPTAGSDGTLTWVVNAVIGSNYRLTFTTRPSLAIGPALATAQLDASGAQPANSPTPANVTVGDTFEPNDTPATAKPISSDSFYLSYITSSSDVDYYTFPVPAAGTRVTFHLSHLPADYDLVVYGPAGAQQLRPAQASTPPLDGDPLADSGYATTHATDALAPQTLNDVALAPGLPVYGVSTLRGTQDDDVAVISDGGQPGDVYTVQVSGFNGASSDQPYMLRAETTPPPAAPGCVPRSFTGTGTVAPALVTTAAGQAATDVNTLFVVDDQQFGNAYGTAGAGVVTKLNAAATLTGFANAGFPSAVVHVDANANVSSAYTAWNACPADPTKANAVVSSIGSVIDSVRQTYPNVEYLVLVGSDDLLPYARLDDLTTVSTENGYASTFPAASALGGSLAAAKILSDDPYGTTAPVPFLNRQLDVPSLVTGRLVETPASINAQLDSFISSATPGHLHPLTALTTGYDFLSDGATAVSTSLGTVAVGTANQSAISSTWTKATLLGPGALFLPTGGAAAPDIVSLNAHADHNRFEPASGTDLLNASEVAAAPQTFAGKLFFSMGCHAGLSVTDAFIPSNNLDWAQVFTQKGAADFAGNTGYGYGDTTTIAYSEDLNQRFAANAVAGAANLTGANLTVGEALTVAKQEYKGALGIVGVYDEKSMAELTLYGLPMYRIGGIGVAPPSGQAAQAQPQAQGAAAQAAIAAPAAVTPNVSPGSFPTDPTTGLHIESFAADRTFGAATATARGSYYSGNDGTLVEHFRPIEPKAIRPVTIDSAHGALLTELTSNDVNPFDPVYARPTVDSSTSEPEVQFDDLAFPSKLQAVTTFQRLQAKKQQVVLAEGQFFATNASDGSGSGTQRLFTHEAGSIFSSPSGDYVPPVFSTLSAQATSGTVSFAVDVTDRDGPSAGTVKRVLVAYLEPGGHVWHFLDLVQSAPGSSRWTGSGALTGSHVQYFVQAVDANGNVAVSTNKGLYYNEVPPPPPPSGGVAVAPTVAVPASGWFNGSADVAVTVNGQPPAPGAATLSIDGGAAQLYTAPVHVTGDGSHTATAQTAEGSATTTFFVDSGPPVITLTTPSANGAVAQGSSTTPVFSCTDAGIGVQSCASTGTAFTTSALGFHTFTVTAVDKLGKTSIASATYDVIRITTPAIGATYARSSTVNADFGCAASTACTANVTKPGGGTVAVTSGNALPTGIQGSYTFTVTNNDTSGHSATLSRAYTVGPAVSAAGKIVFARLGNIWSINPDGTGAVKLTSGLPLDGQPAKSPDGTKIAFSRLSTLLGGRQIWVMDADGQNQVQLTSSGDNTAPAWSPDGSRIAFQSTRAGSKGFDIWVGTWDPALSTPLVNLINLTNTAGDDVRPSWSPTATGRIAFASNRKSNQFEIYSMKTDGTGVTQLTNDPATDLSPNWSPDGTKIAFESNRATSGTSFGYEIYVMGAANGNSQTRLTKLAGDDLDPYWLDGNRIVFSSVNLLGLGVVAPTGGTPSRVPNTILGDSNPG
jgi:WD40-like Beta Propeller Repeat/Right handed beta helix region